MWNRAELKLRGKGVFMRRYWIVVVVAVVLAICSPSSSSGSSSNSGNSSTNQNLVQRLPGMSTVSTIRQLPSVMQEIQVDGMGAAAQAIGATMISGLVTGIAIMVLVVGIILRVLVFNPLIVGIQRFNMENREGNPDLSVLLYSFKNLRYTNIVGIMFMRDLYIFLWSLLFIIPGIIKSYQYRMIPYLLAENANLTKAEAFDFTNFMMTEQKMSTFVLDLSFFGWYILAAITCGILNIFYVRPYVMTTDAELYAVLRDHAIRSGFLTYSTLPGFSTAGFNDGGFNGGGFNQQY